ncbi:MAG TPA: peptidoglycan-associated lipoprotein Pal [Verrucomicrobiae bacterium]|jgi:peptidoglycan-associated lipoprotein|nr:peptidoglycan-associated lipoprotein Pal [Verrucomicrobiae bacterium]
MRISQSFLTVVFVAVLAFAGCSKTTKPDASELANSGRKDQQSDLRNSGSQNGGSQSSLDDLRRGASPTTPEGSALKEIYFDFDSYTLRPDAREALKAEADWLKKNLAVRASIEGHCDERGTTEYNLALGAKRAQAAKDYLVSLGVAADRLSTMSFGREAAVCREHSDACWQKNRRDRFVVQTTRAGM